MARKKKGGGAGGRGGGGFNAKLSQKQKKEKLKEKREKDRRRAERDAEREKRRIESGGGWGIWGPQNNDPGAARSAVLAAPSVVEQEAPQLGKSNVQPGRFQEKLYYDPNKLVTVFAKEPKSVVEARKRACMRPFLPLTRDEDGLVESTASYYSKVIPMPCRPDWSRRDTRETLLAREDAYFRKYLGGLYAEYGAQRLNQFEHNLEVWRQLWRVCEQSDIVLVLVDSRHPLFNFPPSLYEYVTGTQNIPMVLVLTKIDLVPRAALDRWRAWFKDRFPLLHVVEYSTYPRAGDTPTSDGLDPLAKRKRRMPGAGGARMPKPHGDEELLRSCRAIISRHSRHIETTRAAQESFSFEPSHLRTDKERAWLRRQQEEERGEGQRAAATQMEEGGKAKETKGRAGQKGRRGRGRRGKRKKSRQQQWSSDDEPSEVGGEEAEENDVNDNDDEDDDALDAADEKAARRNASYYAKQRVLGELEDQELPRRRGRGEEGEEEEEEEEEVGAGGLRQAKARGKRVPDQYIRPEYVTLGLVGHPNAGKSSLINSLAGKKIVSVSKTPGHTKHLQTLFLNPSTRLCDCPGLVFPAVDMPLALQVLSGLYNVAQLREPYSSVEFLARRIPLYKVYALQPPLSSGCQQEDPASYKWSAWDVTESYAEKRNYRTTKGVLDTYRAGNELLRHALEGQVVLCFAPPIKGGAGDQATPGGEQGEQSKVEQGVVVGDAQSPQDNKQDGEGQQEQREQQQEEEEDEAALSDVNEGNEARWKRMQSRFAGIAVSSDSEN